MRKKALLIFIISFVFFMGNNLFSEYLKEDTGLESILPFPEGWKVKGEVLRFQPENLFEFINGAAEIYLSYDFRSLITAEYIQEESPVSVSVEIYDMGNVKNAFGIYSAERFEDSNFINVGLQGYIEEEVLNFLMDRYYIKMFCFEGGDSSEEILKKFADEICRKVGAPGEWPEVLSYFPEENKIANSEKFFLRNFLGYGFFHNGYTASYLKDGLEFSCFIIEGKNQKDAEEMIKKFLNTRTEGTVEEKPWGFLVKDRYYHNIFIAQKGSYIAGVMKIKEGMEETGEDYLNSLLSSLRAAT